MIYVALILLALALLFDLSVWAWLRANPVPPLMPIPDWRVPRFSPATNHHQAFAATASSAYAVMGATASYLPGATWIVEDPRRVAVYNP